jgi:hypothetical protein
MELVNLGDELVIKVNNLQIVHKNSSEYTEIYKLSVIYKFSDNESYLCYVPLNYQYKFWWQFKINKEFLDRNNIEKKYFGEIGIVIHNENIFKVKKGILGSKCISCLTFIEGVEQGYTCYSCRQNPYPSWRLQND